MFDRRHFIGNAALGGLAAALPFAALAADGAAGLPNLAAKAVPIGADERKARIAKAAQLMRIHDIDALLIEAGLFHRRPLVAQRAADCRAAHARGRTGGRHPLL